MEIERILAENGVITRHDDVKLRGTIDRLLRTGWLVAVLPGVYAQAEAAGTVACRIAAARRSDPDLVVCGRAAAQESFWTTIAVDTVECAVARPRAARRGFRFVVRAIPDELVVEHHRVRWTTPALTALDLSAELGGDPIDRALRSRATTLKAMREALELTRHRSGNVRRREILLDSRDEPWSEAERCPHRLLRAAGVTGWKANLHVTADGHSYYLDIAFRELRLVIEIDGRLHEDEPDMFESDRLRQNALVLDGWMVLRYTWRMLTDEPERFVAEVQRATEALRIQGQWPSRGRRAA